MIDTCSGGLHSVARSVIQILGPSNIWPTFFLVAKNCMRFSQVLRCFFLNDKKLSLEMGRTRALAPGAEFSNFVYLTEITHFKGEDTVPCKRGPGRIIPFLSSRLNTCLLYKIIGQYLNRPLLTSLIENENSNFHNIDL